MIFAADDSQIVSHWCTQTGSYEGESIKIKESVPYSTGMWISSYWDSESRQECTELQGHETDLGADELDAKWRAQGHKNGIQAEIHLANRSRVQVEVH